MVERTCKSVVIGSCPNQATPLILRTGARLVPIPRTGLPDWCDRYLDPPWAGELFASRLWYDTLLAHALQAGAEPMLAVADAVLLPLLRSDAWRLRSLTTDYSLVWRPLLCPSADPDAFHEAGRALGRILRRGSPVLLDTLDADAPGLAELLQGLRAEGILASRFTAFGNWHETLPRDTGWAAYLAARPPTLRTTIMRKLARARREMQFEWIKEPGPALEAGISAYEDVRTRSWKPWEPFPDFDAALMRALAAAGALRLGVLRGHADGRPAAAQYWALDRGGTRALLLKLVHAEEIRAASPGTALTAMMIQRLLEEDGVRELDFGRGDDPYKRLWVGQRHERIGYVLADPLHPAGLFALARQAAAAARRRLRSAPGARKAGAA